MLHVFICILFSCSLLCFLHTVSSSTEAWRISLSLSVPLVSNYNFDKSKQCIGAMTIEIDFLQKKSTDSSPYDSDKMAAEFIQQFNNQAFSVTQQVRVLKIPIIQIHGHRRSRMHISWLCALWCCSVGFFFILFSLPQLVFSFCDKLFGLMVKDIEAMDASILKGEPASGKKQKVPNHMLTSRFMCSQIY